MTMKLEDLTFGIGFSVIYKGDCYNFYPLLYPKDLAKWFHSVFITVKQKIK